MKLVSKAVWSVMGSGVAIGAAFLQSILIARLLGPDGMGRLGYLVWITSILGLIFNLGLNNTATKFVAEAGAASLERGGEVIAYFAIRIVSLTALSVGVFGLLVWFGYVRGPRIELSLCALYLLIFQLNGLFISVSLGFQRFRIVSVLSGVGAVIQVVAVFALIPSFGVAGGLLGMTVGLLPGGVLAIRTLVGRPNHADVKLPAFPIWQYAVPTWIAALLASFAFSRGEVFFLEKYTDNTAVAFFTASLTIASLGTQLPQLLMNALFPHFSALGSANPVGLARTTENCVRLAGWVMIPGALIMAVGAPVWIVKIFGHRFAGAGLPAMVVTLLSGLMMFSPLTQYLQARNRSDLILGQSIVGGVISILGCFLMVPQWGLGGALLARCLAHITANFFLIRSYRRISGLRLPWSLFVRVTTVAGLSVLPLVLINCTGPTNYIATGSGTLLAIIGYAIGTRKFDLLGSDVSRPIASWLAGLPPTYSVIPCRMFAWLTTNEAR